MRLKAVANGATVETLADTTVCDTHIPAGTRLILEFRHVGRGAGGPEYQPARWLDSASENGGQRTGPSIDQKSFLAFGAGPRFCPGRNLAFLESKTAMAMIARNFHIELDQAAGHVDEQLAFTMIPRGLRVRLTERAAVLAAAGVAG